MPGQGCSTGNPIHSHGHSALARPGLVSSSLGTSGGHSARAVSLSGLVCWTRSQSSPVSTVSSLHPGRMETLRASNSRSGVSGDTATLLLASWRSLTDRVYQSAWNTWCDWCATRQIDSLGVLSEVLDFLTSQFRLARLYHTLGLYRSVMSMTLPPIDGVVVGPHPLVSHMLPGAYQSRPSQPCYGSMWNVQAVLDWFRNMSFTHESLKELTLRLTMLLALTGARRCSELQKLDVRFMDIIVNAASFGIPTFTQNQRVGDPAKQFVFPACPQHPPLCVDALRQYSARTERESFPPAAAASANPLLLSLRRPHKPVSPSTVAAEVAPHFHVGCWCGHHRFSDGTTFGATVLG
eukprot:scpid27914/ scgid5713/ 